MSKYEDFDGPDTPQDRFKTIEERRAENKDIEELLDRLDFNWIRAAYVRHMSKTAENVGKINFIPRDRVNIVFDMNAVAVFNAKENEIFIDPDSVRHGAYISGAPTSLFLLHDIVHEEGHAVSKILLAGDEVRDRKSVV